MGQVISSQVTGQVTTPASFRFPWTKNASIERTSGVLLCPFCSPRPVTSWSHSSPWPALTTRPCQLVLTPHSSEGTSLGRQGRLQALQGRRRERLRSRVAVCAVSVVWGSLQFSWQVRQRRMAGRSGEEHQGDGVTDNKTSVAGAVLRVRNERVATLKTPHSLGRRQRPRGYQSVGSLGIG